MDTQIFKYKESEICFQTEGGSVMVNATEMAKSFDKRPVDWLNLPSTKLFLSELSIVRNSNNSMVQTVRGSSENGGGTWMHEDVALEFARWLSPAFAIWCNDRIKELLKHGITATSQTIDSILADPDNAIRILTELKEERAKNKLLEACNQDNVKKLNEQAPKVLFADSVAGSNKSILIGELAKIITQNGIEIGQNRLFTWLRTNGYLGTRGENYNIPTQRAIEQKLFEIKETTINQPGGRVITTLTTKVTGKGQIYFVNKFLYKALHK